MENCQNVFSPFKIGNVDVKNRIEMAPVSHMLASTDGMVTREMIAFYQSLARGGAGIITIGESPIDFGYAKGHEYQLNLGDDRVVAGLSVLTEAIHRYGAKVSIEISHNGRQRFNHQDAIAPSPITPVREEILAAQEGRRKIRVTEMNQDMIDMVIENFAGAVERCMKAGFEMVMIHGAHGHLLAQFLSPYSNKRTDGYGGSLENRAKFAMEVLTAIRKKVGNKIALEYRISADELVPGGMREEETIEFVKMIEDKIDLLHVSAGLLSDPSAGPHMIQPTYFPHGYNVHYAERFKKALSIPIATVGSISDLEMADNIIAEGKADIVAMARAIIADPEVVNKTRRGEIDEIRPCLRCNTCARLTASFYPIRCAVNPVIGRELDYSRIFPADKKKKVVIAGGGPAGMEAALTASSRGHEVVIYEKEGKLGGNLIPASNLSFKGDMKRYLDWLIRQTKQAGGVTVKLNSEATADKFSNEHPDVIIVAVGCEPLIPDIPGVEKANVVWVGDVDTGRATVGETVVIAGGGLSGLETALSLAQQGKKVTVIDMLEEKQLGMDGPRGLMQLLHERGVRFVTEVKLEEITNQGAKVIDKEWHRFEIPSETVILSLGFKPRTEIAHAFNYLAPDVYVIGDAGKPRNLKCAIHDGFNVAVEI